jgi:nicotinate-nucleotide adenylyltransferase
MKIGILGGSFNPAHFGHVYISNIALKILQLDEIWWLVSPQNPLKVNYSTASLKDRLKNAKKISNGYRIRVENLESNFKTNLTAKTLKIMIERYKGTKFIWLMGADNLKEINNWFNWKAIFNTMPVAVFDRGVYSYSVINSVAGKCYFSKLHKTKNSKSIFNKSLPAWKFIHIYKNPLSSTYIRKLM